MPNTSTTPGQYIGLDDDPPFQAALTFTDANNQTVPPDDIPQWATSDATIANISSTSPDGTTATIAVAGRVGSCTLTGTSTDKNGTKIVATGTVIINAGEAVAAVMTFPSAAAPAAVAAADPTAPSTSATPAGEPAATAADPAASGAGTPAPAGAAPTA